MGPLGMQELIVIFLVALLVFGPRKLPELGKSLGKGLREFKRATNEMKATWDDQMRDVESEVRATSRDIRNVEKDLKKSFDEPRAVEKPAGDASPGDADSTTGETEPPPQAATADSPGAPEDEPDSSSASAPSTPSSTSPTSPS